MQHTCNRHETWDPHNEPCIFTPQGPTWEKGGCVERRGGIERASGRIGFRGKRNSGLEAGFDQVKVQIRDWRNHETMRRVEEGEEHRRAAVLEDTMSIAVADFGCFAQGELGGG